MIRTFIDDVQREVIIKSPIRRVISLCPSITETLVELQVPLVGRTRFCIHPESIKEKIPNVGGTKDVSFERIEKLHPDLIIAEKEENTKEMIQVLEKICPVYVFDIENINQALKMITTIGDLVQVEKAASQISNKIRLLLESISSIHSKTVAYFIWMNPYMVAGKNTYIQSIIDLMGSKNIFLNHPGRYPKISHEDLIEMKPEVILLSSEPYPFKEKHLDDFKKILPNSKVLLVDGEMFSWYGVRMLKAIPYLKQIQNELLK